MIKRFFLLLTLTAVSLFALNFQTASKDDLMGIKGIGEKKAEAIMKYRKKNKIKSAADLENVPGIGKEIANNAKKGIKNADKKAVKKKVKKEAKEKAGKKIDKKKKKVKKAKKIKEKKVKVKKKVKEKAKKTKEKIKN